MENGILELINKGEIFYDIQGSTPNEVYKNITKEMHLPQPSDEELIYKALCAREAIMSTAVGNGIALPHARSPIIKNESDQRIYIAYLKTPLDMKAPDNIKVFVMFVILTQNPQTHLQTLSALVGLFNNPTFRKLLEEHAEKEELLKAIKEI